MNAIAALAAAGQLSAAAKPVSDYACAYPIRCVDRHLRRRLCRHTQKKKHTHLRFVDPDLCRNCVWRCRTNTKHIGWCRNANYGKRNQAAGRQWRIWKPIELERRFFVWRFSEIDNEMGIIEVLNETNWWVVKSANNWSAGRNSMLGMYYNLSNTNESIHVLKIDIWSSTYDPQNSTGYWTDNIDMNMDLNMLTGSLLVKIIANDSIMWKWLWILVYLINAALFSSISLIVAQIEQTNKHR